MIPERAFRFVQADETEISAYDFFAPRQVVLLNRVAEYRRNRAQQGHIVDTEPLTLTGDAWCDAVDERLDEALGAVY